MEQETITAAEVMAIKTMEAGSTAGLAVAAVGGGVAAGAAELAGVAVIIIINRT